MESEGLSVQPYSDSGGHKSIGYGHKVIPGEQFGKITQDYAKVLMSTDVKPIEAFLNSNITTKLTQNQFDALVMFIFNIGRTAFLNSSVYSKIQSGDFDGAEASWRRWVNVTVRTTDKNTGEVLRELVPVKGLINRRETEIKLFNEV